MLSIARFLRAIAAVSGAAILTTSHLVAGNGGVLKPALGDSWRNQSHIQVLLTQNEQAQTVATLL
jgi:RAD51-like protein 3